MHLSLSYFTQNTTNIIIMHIPFLDKVCSQSLHVRGANEIRGEAVTIAIMDTLLCEL